MTNFYNIWQIGIPSTFLTQQLSTSLMYCCYSTLGKVNCIVLNLATKVTYTLPLHKI